MILSAAFASWVIATMSFVVRVPFSLAAISYMTVQPSPPVLFSTCYTTRDHHDLRLWALLLPSTKHLRGGGPLMAQMTM